MVTPTGELAKVVSIDSANTITVAREQDGAGIATGYAIGQTITSIGSSSLVTNAEVWKDFTGVSTQFRTTNASLLWDARDDYLKIDDEFIKVTGVTTDTTGLTSLTRCLSYTSPSPRD